uniref:MipA/OmpV family protein n=1 Tax=Haemonchus placei TaxID=6290 RepID=A0A0N4W4U3_HAEPC
LFTNIDSPNCFSLLTSRVHEAPLVMNRASSDYTNKFFSLSYEFWF